MVKLFENYNVPFDVNPEFNTKVAYFCMEFGIDQALKTYSGGLGFLAGSHVQSAYDLKQNFIGIGILWSQGYYDQVLDEKRNMRVLFKEKIYSYLYDTEIQFSIKVHDYPVQVRVMYLHPKVFNTAPIFLLTTDFEDNDERSRKISHRLYDADHATKISQYILLGIGGAKLLDIIEFNPDIYHFNEAHPLPGLFYLYNKIRDVEALKKQIVFTTHTPVAAGNDVNDANFLNEASFFDGTHIDEAKQITGIKDNQFNHTLAMLRVAKKANGVSELHGHVARDMWYGHGNICEIDHITNSQNAKYWKDKWLWEAYEEKDFKKFTVRKQELKTKLFKEVADQTGNIFDPEVLTMVWARRFTGYKRVNLLMNDMARFTRLMQNSEYPLQIIFAGKPYPVDGRAIDVYNHLLLLSDRFEGMAVLTGYELALSKLLKQGSDIWLNTPRRTQEASGTSGMTAAMNGSVNCSVQDGWIPEFAKHKENAFVLPILDQQLGHEEIDHLDAKHLFELIEEEILPTYYDRPEKWIEIACNSMRDVIPQFDSNRMAAEYYHKLYDANK